MARCKLGGLANIDHESWSVRSQQQHHVSSSELLDATTDEADEQAIDPGQRPAQNLSTSTGGLILELRPRRGGENKLAHNPEPPSPSSNHPQPGGAGQR